MYPAGIVSLTGSFPPAVAEGRPGHIHARSLSKRFVDYEETENRRRALRTNEGRWKSY
jgi:hypothetical protein